MAVEARSPMGDGPLDPQLTMQAANAFTGSAKAMYRAVLVGSLWTSHEAAKAGYVEHPCCPFCGSNQDGVDHHFWFCPAFAEARQPLVDGAAGITFEALPSALRL
eukprot:1608171-Alexandrium_andersonii.AAC.1